MYFYFFFFNDTATTEIYTLSLHDALPICRSQRNGEPAAGGGRDRHGLARALCRPAQRDRKSTRLNSSHSSISYAVFCLKKKIQRIPSNLLLPTAREHAHFVRSPPPRLL